MVVGVSGLGGGNGAEQLRHLGVTFICSFFGISQVAPVGLRFASKGFFEIINCFGHIFLL